MALKKSALAVAVTVALSSHAFAGSIEIESTDKNATYSLSDARIPVYDGTVGILDEEKPQDADKKTIGYDHSSGNGGAEVLGYANKSLSISGTIDMIDVELKSNEILGSGAAADNPHGLEFKNAISKSTYIETNSATINTDGSGNAINILDSTLNATTVDEDGNKVEPHLIYNNGGDITASNNDAIAITNSTVTGNILNGSTARKNDLGQAQPATSGTIKGNRAGIKIEKTTFTGSIINEKDSLIDGTYGISVDGSSRYKGDIDNIGTIKGSTTGISLSGDKTQFNGEINNTGIITGGDNSDHSYGIFIDDSVAGKVVINQRDGELNGYTALRMNKHTKANFTGGDIIGNVSNHGGAFYVEGNQTIAGDYMQTAGSTLAMGLHKETSLTANNISLDKESTVLIDLSKGDMYIRNGDSVELLKVTADGKITDEADYAIASKLVSIADIKKEDDKVTLTFKRDKFVDSSNASSQRQADNFNNLGAALANISKNLPSDTPVETIRYFNALLAVIEENPEAALPDVSGASKAAAMSATNQSNTQVSVRARGLASGDALENTGLWVQGIVSKGQQDDRNNEAYDVKSHGFVLGADTELGNGAVAGAAYSFIKNEINTQNSRTESDYHMATLYGAQAMDQVLLDGQVYYAWGSNDSSRDIGANASYDSNLYGARVGAGYQFDLDNAARFIPTLSLEASRLSVDGYTESGFGALKMDKQHFNRLELGLSTELSKDYQLSKAMVTPSITLGAFHDFKADTQNSTVAFAVAPAETFNVEGNKPEKTRYVAGAGVDIVNNGNLTVSAEYNYNWNTDGFDANSGALKFRWDF